MKKYGFIGYGNMGKMIIENILNLNIFTPNELIVSNKTLSKLNKLKKKYPDITITDDNTYLAENSDKIFIFVKTPEFKDLISEIAPFCNDDSHIVHVCAGLSFENISNCYNGSVSQVIPSIVSTFNGSNNDFECFESKYKKLGISLISHSKNTSNSNKCLVEEIFNEFSYIQIIDDFKFSDNENNDLSIEIATILASCFPSFISFIINLLSNIANLKSENKISIDEAKYIIVKTILSTIIQIDTDNLSTSDIINKTSTKKGITEIGLNYLDDNANKLLDELFDSLIERYDEVKNDLNENYS